jgi:hypothetical protein
MVCHFKIAVYVDEKPNVINKTDFDFMKLGLEMKKLFPHKLEVAPPEPGRKHSNLKTYGE